MDRVTQPGTLNQVVSTSTQPRPTATPARPFSSLMSGGATLVAEGAQAAMRHIPGGPIVAAAVRDGRSDALGSGLSGAVASPEGPTPGGLGLPGVNAPGLPGGLSSEADQTLYFIELQQKISAESRTFSLVSNILKSRHETMKNAISNIG